MKTWTAPVLTVCAVITTLTVIFALILSPVKENVGKNEKANMIQWSQIKENEVKIAGILARFDHLNDSLVRIVDKLDK